MADIKAGVVCVTKFCRAGNKEFQAYIDYIEDVYKRQVYWCNTI